MSDRIEALEEKVKQLENDVKFAGATRAQCDFKVFKDPRSWEGESCAGDSILKMADSLSYLGKLANLLDWQAKQDEAGSDEKKKKYARYKRMDAARCRRLINIKMGTKDTSDDDQQPAGGDGIPF